MTGTLPLSNSVSLVPSYNLVFSPSNAEISVEAALSPLKLGVNYSKVLYYNATQGVFQEYSSVKKEFFSLKPGIAYYVNCLKTSTWAVTNSSVSNSAVFVYDGDGSRVKKINQAGSTVYIGSLFEIDATGRTTKQIFAGPNRICAVDSTGDKSFYHTDHLGSSNVITDSTGKQIGWTEFAPYGSVSKQNGSHDPKYKFTGKELDNTGLYFYGARYMDPQLGRFITADTIVQAPYDPQSLNRYSYCRNNPINYTDPTGHKWSWSNFWRSLIGAVVTVIVTIVTYGMGASWSVACFWGGMLGGATTGGLQGGWQGALMGGAMGGMLGSIGGLGVDRFGWQFGMGMFLAGTAYAGATNSWDSYAGAFVGGLVGSAVGGAIVDSGQFQSFNNWKGGYGFKSNNDVIDVLAKEGRFQEAIDFAAKRYDLPSGRYDPNNSDFGSTDIVTGEVTYGKLAFSGRSQLQATGFHEGRHVWQLRNNKYIFDWGKQDPLVNRYSLEIDAGKQTLSNAWKLNLTKQAIQDERNYLRSNQLKESWKNQGAN